MESVTKSSVLPLKRSSDEVMISKAEIDRQLEDLISIQQSHSERLESIEKEYTEEIKKVHDIFKNLGRELDRFKSHVNDSIQDQIKINLAELVRIQNEDSHRLARMEQLVSTFETNLTDDKMQAIRQELIEGIRLLGERVSKAMEEMNNRFKNLQVVAEKAKPTEVDEKSDQLNQLEFVERKESPGLNLEKYEIIPKDATERLSQLFIKQSQGIKKFVEEQKAKIIQYEQVTKKYNEEKNQMIVRLEQRIKNNFRLSILGILGLVILMIVFKFIV